MISRASPTLELSKTVITGHDIKSLTSIKNTFLLWFTGFFIFRQGYINSLYGTKVVHCLLSCKEEGNIVNMSKQLVNTGIVSQFKLCTKEGARWQLKESEFLPVVVTAPD